MSLELRAAGAAGPDVLVGDCVTVFGGDVDVPVVEERCCFRGPMEVESVTEFF